jgi:hypothetical protein
MNFRSYVSKTFVVESSKAIIRDEQLKEQRYQQGDEIPPGKQAGDVKTIPQRTEIKVSDVKADVSRHTFIFAAAAKGERVYGWTAAMNLEGGFKNETAGLAPSKWDLEPSGHNMTCIDGNALICVERRTSYCSVRRFQSDRLSLLRKRLLTGSLSESANSRLFRGRWKPVKRLAGPKLRT